MTGEPRSLPFSVYQTVPVDLNGDGCHELVRGIQGGDGQVFDRHGNGVGSIGGPVAMASHFLDYPGEQLLAFYPDGVIRVWTDGKAQDCPEALARYAHSFYATNERLTSNGSNLGVLAGI